MKAREIENVMERLQQQLDRLAVFGEDDWEDETVLMFQREGWLVGGERRLLSYVAIKKSAHWWLSDGKNRPVTWEQLIELMADSPEVWVATEWEALV